MGFELMELLLDLVLQICFKLKLMGLLGEFGLY